MKTIINFILLILMLTISSCGQNASNKIIGSWLYKGVENNSNVVECPDVLVFGDDNLYSILNDCYGNDVNNPIVEKGKWIFNVDENIISLKDRKFSSNYFFHDSVPVINFYIKEISDKSMKICFNNNSLCKVEKYQKQPRRTSH